MAEKTQEQWNTEFLIRDIGRIAQDLRDLADRIEHYKNHVPKIGTGPGWTSYGQIAYDVVHDVTWGFANVHVDRVIRHATDADVARAKGE